MEPIAHPPETIEGWYALHQIFAVTPAARAASDARACAAAALQELACPPEGGWSALFQLVGSKADVMLLHFRPTLDDIGAAQQRVAREPLFQQLARVYSFLSVTELGLYHLTAELARAAAARGGEVGDAEYRSALADRARAERESAHVQRRLYPPLPTDMPYVCF